MYKIRTRSEVAKSEASLSRGIGKTESIGQRLTGAIDLGHEAGFRRKTGIDIRP